MAFAQLSLAGVGGVRLIHISKLACAVLVLAHP